MESRLITLNSEDAQKLNGDYNSNLFFNIPSIVDENPDISHLEVSLDSATIPVSWYLINDLTNTLSYVYNSSPFTLTLTKGNYNGSTMITELTNKLSIAYGTGNGYLANQVSMALETYNVAMQKKLQEMFPKDQEEKYKNKIDIS